MGLLDKFKKKSKGATGKLDDLAAKHHDKIDKGIDKAAELAKSKAPDKHDAKIDSAAEKAKGMVDKLADKDDK